MEADAGLAPLALFAFRRVGPLARTLASLKACPEFEHSPVYVFSDAARTASQEREVDEVRALIQGQLTPNMRLICAPNNRGLAESIIKGVTELCETYGRVIVIEDDLLVSPSILTWFNQALDRFADCEKVMQVSGHMFHVPALAKRREGLFLPFTTSWGWATWKRAWDAFDPQAQGWEELRRDRALRKRFNLDGHYNYARMLARQMRGELDSWAIRWYWSVFRNEGLCLFPPQTLVINVGADDRATHKRIVKRLARKILPIKRELKSASLLMPDNVEIEQSVWKNLIRAVAQSRWWGQ